MSDLESAENKVSGVESAEKTVLAKSVPEALVQRDKWVCWRYDEGKKPPYDPEAGEKRDPYNPETWSDFESALNAYRHGEYDGIGFVLTADDPFTGFDFDDCRNRETGEIQQEIEEIIGRLDSYTETSPSETGLHTLAIGDKPDRFGSKSGDGIEVYDSDQYFTVTGKHLEGTPETIKERQDTLLRICETYLKQAQDGEEMEYDAPDIGEAGSEHLELGKQALHDLQEESTAAFNSVMAFLQGDISDFGRERLIKENGLINRSGQEFVGVSLLYSTLNRYLGKSEKPLREMTWSIWTHYCRSHPRTNDNQKRRWLTDTQDYRGWIFNHAISKADAEKFGTMVENKGASLRRENDEYSRLTYGALWNALFEQIPGFGEIENLLSLPPTSYNDMDPSNPATEPGKPDGHGSANRDLHELYPSKSEVIDRAYEIDDGYNEWASYEEAFRRLQAKHGEVKAANIDGTTWVYYPVHYPDPPEACYVLLEGEQMEPEEPDSTWTPPEEAPEQEVMTDGGTPMSKTESHDKLEQIRQANSGEQSEGPEVLVCPLCDQPMLSEGSLRNHASQSRDADHRGMTLDDSLEPVEKHKVEEILREQYVEREKTLKELEEEWGVSRGTIHYWLDKYDIERRQPVTTRVERATYYTDVEGYEKASSYISSEGKVARVRVHQLLACLSHEPEEVFSPDKHVHHRSEIPWLNIPGNLELLSPEEHQQAHQADEWAEEEGIPVLVTPDPIDEEEYHSMWGPGLRGESEEESIYSENDPWGPGAPA
jgi:hypothetical protein